MRLANIDLNMLVALDALLAERSVTRAAQRLGLTQPTLSATLARLRRHFDDQLLYRSGNTYQLTPLAMDLAARTPVALGGVERIFASQKSADPANLTREFVVACSDYTAAVIGASMAAAISRGAPRASIHLRHSEPGGFAGGDEKLRSMDGVILPHGFMRKLPHLDLYRDDWVCLVSTDNDSVGDELTMSDLARLPWAVTFRAPTFQTTAMRQLAQMGVDIQIQATVDSFLAVPFVIVGTGRVALVPRRLADMFDTLIGLRVLPCPFDAGEVVEALWWHPDFERDAEHAWLRQQVGDLVSKKETTQA